MAQEELLNQIANLEREIAILPEGSITKNIQHSLRMYQYGGHFRQLLDLHERVELTNTVLRL